MEWLISNLGTLAVIIILAAAVGWIVFGLVRDKKAGKHSCGGNCANCACGCSNAVGRKRPAAKN